MKIKNIFILVALLLPTYSFAGGIYIGKLQPYYYANSLHLIPTNAENKPACATRSYIRLPDAEGSLTFNSKFSIILASWMSKQVVEVTGTGQCTSEGDEIILTILPR